MSDIFYVVQLTIPSEKRSEWQQWYKTDHLPKVLAQPGFKRVDMFEVVESPQGHSFWARYTVESLEALAAYRASAAAKELQKEYRDKFPDFPPATRVVLTPAII